MCVDVSLIPLLGRTNTAVRKVTRLGGLAVRLDAAAFVERDLAVVACARGGGAVFYFCAREFAFDVCGVDAGFGCCWRRRLVGVWWCGRGRRMGWYGMGGWG